MSTNNRTDGGKPKLSDGQKQMMKKYAVFTLMGVIFAGCIWFIFAPSADEKAKQGARAGFNADIPMPKEETIIGDKRDAYEQERVKQKQEDRMRSLSDFTALLGGGTPEQPGDLALITGETTPATNTGGGNIPRAQSPIQESAMAYNNINRTLEDFYETGTPAEDPEKEQLRLELEELKMRMDETESRKSQLDEQLSLMEKSFRMAAKYIPGTVGQTGGDSTTVPKTKGGAGVRPVKQVRQNVVSLLVAPMPDDEFIESFSRPRNTGFITAAGNETETGKNTILASVYQTVTLSNGKELQLRLLEPMIAGDILIPAGTILTGSAKINGERLHTTITSIQHAGNVLPVEMEVYGTDGIRGIFVPNPDEATAMKDIAANMGTSMGSSITITDDAVSQLAADLGRSAIQGASQFFSKKMREVKVTLKAGYKVLLIPENK